MIFRRKPLACKVTLGPRAGVNGRGLGILERSPPGRLIKCWFRR